MPEKLIIPFKIEKEQAQDIFFRLFSKRKFTPMEFIEAARRSQIEKVYFPVRLFECETLTSIKAESGTEQKLRSEFSEILFSAGQAVDDPLLRLLEPYSLEETVAAAAGTAEGAEIKPSDIPAQEIAEQLKEIVRSLTEQTAKQEYKAELTEQSFEKIEQTEILLPMWVLHCEYKKEPYNLFINGQTGKTAGIPPNSVSKIAAITAAGAFLGGVIGEIVYLAVKSL